jgi:hypothetical protein
MRRSEKRRPTDLSLSRSSGLDLTNRLAEFDPNTASEHSGDWAEGPLAAWETAWIDIGGEG